jgi:septum formation protein
MGVNMKQKIILASNSPRRKELLEQSGIKFEIVPSGFEENMSLKLSNTKLAKKLAYGKAKDVADRLKKGIIIGCDTFITISEKRIGKPKNKKDAERILNFISGKWINVYSGIAIIDAKNKKRTIDYELSKVKIKKMTSEEIKWYLKTNEWRGKAGAFAIQGKGSIFIEKINGCYFNIVGLPLNNLYKNLKKLKINILNHVVE